MRSLAIGIRSVCELSLIWKRSVETMPLRLDGEQPFSGAKRGENEYFGRFAPPHNPLYQG